MLKRPALSLSAGIVVFITGKISCRFGFRWSVDTALIFI